MNLKICCLISVISICIVGCGSQGIKDNPCGPAPTELDRSISGKLSAAIPKEITGGVGIAVEIKREVTPILREFSAEDGIKAYTMHLICSAAYNSNFTKEESIEFQKTIFSVFTGGQPAESEEPEGDYSRFIKHGIALKSNAVPLGYYCRNGDDCQLSEDSNKGYCVPAPKNLLAGEYKQGGICKNVSSTCGFPGEIGKIALGDTRAFRGETLVCLIVDGRPAWVPTF